MTCRYHLLINVTDGGQLRINEPLEQALQWEIDWTRQLEIPATCALDVAEDGYHLLDEVGAFVGMTRERVRQIEEQALQKAKDSGVELEDPGEHPEDPYLRHMMIDYSDATFFRAWVKKNRAR